MTTVPYRESVVAQHDDLRDYAIRLATGIDDDNKVAQPIKGVTMNHPAWVYSHLAIYGPVMIGVMQGEAINDPKDEPHGLGSSPQADPGAYLPMSELLQTFVQGYQMGAAAYLEATDKVLSSPSNVERWRERFPTAQALAVHLLVKHFATHLGQLSAWCRAMGMPAV